MYKNIYYPTVVVNFRFNYPTVGIYYPTVVEGEMIVLHRTIHVAVRKSALGADSGISLVIRSPSNLGPMCYRIGNTFADLGRIVTLP